MFISTKIALEYGSFKDVTHINILYYVEIEIEISNSF